MTIPFVDFDASLTPIQPALDDAWHRVSRSRHFILGPELEQFENDFAAYCEVGHCVGVGTGLDALELALRALGVQQGDEVIVPSHTFIATWLAVAGVGATPVPVEPRAGFLLDAAAVSAAITPRTRGIIPVHLYGEPVDLDGIQEVAARHGLFVLEDAAQAHGVRHHGRRVGGSASTAAAFSFYPTKNLGALGDGGAVTTNDAKLAERLRLLRNYGSRRKYEHLEAGRNSRLDELQAALLNAKLPHLDRWNADRQERAAQYTQALARLDGIAPPQARGPDSVWHLYVIRVREGRDALAEFLARHGVQTLIHYPQPCHLQPAFAGLGLGPGSLPAAEALAGQVLSLPMWPGLSAAAVDRVCELIAAWTQDR